MRNWGTYGEEPEGRGGMRGGAWRPEGRSPRDWGAEGRSPGQATAGRREQRGTATGLWGTRGLGGNPCLAWGKVPGALTCAGGRRLLALGAHRGAPPPAPPPAAPAPAQGPGIWGRGRPRGLARAPSGLRGPLRAERQSPGSATAGRGRESASRRRGGLEPRPGTGEVSGVARPAQAPGGEVAPSPGPAQRAAGRQRAVREGVLRSLSRPRS